MSKMIKKEDEYSPIIPELRSNEMKINTMSKDKFDREVQMVLNPTKVTKVVEKDTAVTDDTNQTDISKNMKIVIGTFAIIIIALIIVIVVMVLKYNKTTQKEPELRDKISPNLNPKEMIVSSSPKQMYVEPTQQDLMNTLNQLKENKKNESKLSTIYESDKDNLSDCSDNATVVEKNTNNTNVDLKSSNIVHSSDEATVELIKSDDEDEETEEIEIISTKKNDDDDDNNITTEEDKRLIEKMNFHLK